MDNPRRAAADWIRRTWARPSVRKVLLYLMLAMILVDIALLITGQRVLIGEKWEGEPSGVPYTGGFMLPIENGGDRLTCSYFTGRSVQVEYFNTRVDAALGEPEIDECPFLYTPRI